MKIPFEIRKEINNFSYPLLFLTLSGSHLYGFAEDQSDFDFRGVHVLPQKIALGITSELEVINQQFEVNEQKVELISHDVKRFFQMLLDNNGYAMEQVFSPLTLNSSPEHIELRDIAPEYFNKQYHTHYQGFAKKQWKLVEKKAPFVVKPLLYVYRSLFTGIILMKYGEMHTNLEKMNQSVFKYPFISELVQLKTNFGEQAQLSPAEVKMHADHIEKLHRRLSDERDKSKLPETIKKFDSLNELLIRLRE